MNNLITVYLPKTFLREYLDGITVSISLEPISEPHVIVQVPKGFLVLSKYQVRGYKSNCSNATQYSIRRMNQMNPCEGSLI